MKTGAQARPRPIWASMATVALGAAANATPDTAPTPSSHAVGRPTPKRSNASPTGICATAKARKKHDDRAP